MRPQTSFSRNEKAETLISKQLSACKEVNYESKMKK
jgi:hypothetical protein